MSCHLLIQSHCRKFVKVRKMREMAIYNFRVSPPLAMIVLIVKIRWVSSVLILIRSLVRRIWLWWNYSKMRNWGLICSRLRKLYRLLSIWPRICKKGSSEYWIPRNNRWWLKLMRNLGNCGIMEDYKIERLRGIRIRMGNRICMIRW